MAVNQGSDDPAVDNIFGPAAVMRLRLPSSDRFVSIPSAFDLQTLLVICAAPVAIVHGALILKSLLAHDAAGSLFCFIELQGSRIDAIAKIGRRRSVFENMAQMGIAFAAQDFSPAHKKAAVLLSFHVLFRDRSPKTGPARPRVKLGIGAE